MDIRIQCPVCLVKVKVDTRVTYQQTEGEEHGALTFMGSVKHTCAKPTTT